MKPFNNILMTLLSAALLLGCDKLDSGDNGVFINGVMDADLQSAFVGGSIANPERGSSYRCHLYSDFYADGPSWDKVEAKVYISGFRYAGKSYKDNGDFIDNIIICNVASIGDLEIPMNQGKYEGGNEYVSSVSIDEYYRAPYDIDGNRKTDSRFVIRIMLKDKRRIDIRYIGKTPFDNYF